MTAFTETTGSIARLAGVSAPTVRLYADSGLIEYVMAANHTRLYRPEAAEEVKALLAKRLANRGQRRSA
ncbi:MAG TPA: MerR family DNA-binding transcriptional regulator [Solirubrobacteraceae bacterium]|nr:MerR family DNA-binding transcriptional regulator [Solirubrobacteraceae bacterium]